VILQLGSVHVCATYATHTHTRPPTRALELNGAPQNAQPIRPRVPGNLGSGGYWDMGIGIGVGIAQRKRIVTGLDVKKIFFNVWIII